MWGWWGAAEGCSGCGMLSVGGPTQTPRREEGALSISALSHPCKHMRRQNEDMHLKSASRSAIFQVVPLSHRFFGFSFFIFMAYSCLHLKTQVPCLYCRPNNTKTYRDRRRSWKNDSGHSWQRGEHLEPPMYETEVSAGILFFT